MYPALAGHDAGAAGRAQDCGRCDRDSRPALRLAGSTKPFDIARTLPAPRPRQSSPATYSWSRRAILSPQRPAPARSGSRSRTATRTTSLKQGVRHRIVGLARPPAIRCPPDPSRPRRRHARRPPRQGLVLGRDRPQPHLRVQRRRRPDRHPAPRSLVGGKDWPTGSEAVSRIHANWRAPFGDRRQELVFVGTGIDRAALTAALEACLVSRPRMPFAPGRNFHGKIAAAGDAHTGKSRASS